MRFACLVSLMLLTAVAVPAQYGRRDDDRRGPEPRREVLSRRADIRGGGGPGKCTIEVEVDGVAEVEIRGDMGRLRTLRGETSIWRRFVCNREMPLHPEDFRFRGIDGRGRQELISPPGRDGIVVVRIEDPRGGREGYTFDIEWRGGYDDRDRDRRRY
jgi:hypothetical protein